MARAIWTGSINFGIVKDRSRMSRDELEKAVTQAGGPYMLRNIFKFWLLKWLWERFRARRDDKR